MGDDTTERSITNLTVIYDHVLIAVLRLKYNFMPYDTYRSLSTGAICESYITTHALTACIHAYTRSDAQEDIRRYIELVGIINNELPELGV